MKSISILREFDLEQVFIIILDKKEKDLKEKKLSAFTILARPGWQEMTKK